MSDPERPTRGPGTRSPLLQAAVGVALIAVIVGFLVLVIPAGSPVSTAPTPRAVAAATAACNWQSDHDRPRLLAGAPILTATRGSYLAVVYLVHDKTYQCISDGEDDHTSIGMASLEMLYVAPGPDQLGLPGESGGSAPGFSGGGPNAVELHLVGRAGSDVSAVRFVFAGGSTVNATVSNGWYFAWWSAGQGLGQQIRPTSVRVTTKSGTVTSPMLGSGCRLGASSCVFAGLNSHTMLPATAPRRTYTYTMTTPTASAPGPPTATIGVVTTPDSATVTLTATTGSG